MPTGFLETSNGHILMNGVGTDFWSTADQGHFVYKQLSGDGAITARVESLTATDAWAKAGVMIRQTLDPSSTWALALASPGHGAHFQARLTLSASAVSDTSLTNLPTEQTSAQIPLWVKLERKGDQLSAYYATGETPTTWIANPWNPQTIAMSAQVYIGLAVTAHTTTGAVTQAEFSNVATTGNVTGQWQSVSLGVDQPTGNVPDTLYVTLEDSGGRKATAVNSDPYAVTVNAWTQWDIPLSAFSSASVKTDSIKKMTIGIGDKTRPASKATGLIYIDDIAFGRPAAK
jgi:regulation of enolase protein 1 (concanavalin A-like superfamily)